MIKLEYTITIPAAEFKTDYRNTKSFISSYRNVAGKLFNWMKNKLNEQQIKINEHLQICFDEVIRNAYDAFIEKAEHEDLILKMIIKQINDNSLLVKLSDNGKGFINHEKSVEFMRNSIENPHKDKTFYLGGDFIGLNLLENILSKNHATLYFKNRKNEGASVYMKFPMKEKENIEKAHHVGKHTNKM